MSLVSLTAAKVHLRISGTASDTDITSKIAIAEALAAEYIAATYVDGEYVPITVDELEYEYGEDTNTVVHAAVLLLLTNLFDKRDEDPMTPGVKNLLSTVRPPVIV